VLYGSLFPPRSQKNYIELRGLQGKLNNLESSVDAQEETIKLTKELIDRNLVSEIDLNKAEAEKSTLLAERPAIELGIARSIHRLSILLGYEPGALFDCLQTTNSLPKLPSEQPIGMPSELLRRRPDIVKAERELAAATERVSSAIAALFPRFSLRGFIGEISTKAGSIFKPSSATYLIGPQLLVPIFNSQLLLQDVEYNKLVVQESLYNYQKTVLEALEEAENAIMTYRQGEKRHFHLEEAYESYRKTLGSAIQLYQTGVENFLVVMTAQKSLLAAKESVIQSQVDLLLNYVALYKALGGSWDD
jgi:NodT family efflux transporter outer membrane factor (OMF) lipoprotein